MNQNNILHDKEAINKLKSLVEEISICLFCSNLKIDDGASCRPMAVQKVCDQGNLWFFSEKNSEKNKEIEQNHIVQLFFSHPEKGRYLVVNGEAEIIIDSVKTEELWSPSVETWFKHGKDDPNISIIKVMPISAYFWDTNGNKMINCFETKQKS